MAQIIHLKFKAVAERRLRYSVISKPRRRTCIQLWHRSILDDKSFLILYLPLLQRLPVPFDAGIHRPVQHRYIQPTLLIPLQHRVVIPLSGNAEIHLQVHDIRHRRHNSLHSAE